MFHHFPGMGIPLDFIKDDDRFPFVQFGSVDDGESYEEAVQVVAEIFKQRDYRFGRIREVDDNVTFVVLFCKRFDGIGFSYSSSTFDKKAGASLGRLFPLEQFLGNMPS
jgi:hypothetical protein